MKIRIYYEDTDCGGVVYHSNYLKYMERSRTEYLRNIGISLADYHNKGIVFAVTEVNIQYRFPAKYDDLLTIETVISELNSYRMEFATKIINQDGKLCAKGIAKVVAVNEATGKLSVIEKEFYNKLKKSFDEQESK